MAVLDSSQFDHFAIDFEEISKLPDDVLLEMVTKGGEKIKEAVRKTAESMLQGPYSRGVVKSGLKLGKVKRTADGSEIYVTFEGNRGKTRIAEIAFINEFGKKSQPARPFIRTANEQSADDVSNEMKGAIDRFYSEKGF